jgi:hypothetical protein
MTVKELIEELKQFPEDIEVVVSYNDPGSDEPLIMGLGSDWDVDTFWDYDGNKESDESLIIRL